MAPSPRNFVVIDDPLPAGFEAIDANLANTASWLRVPQAGGEPDAVDCPGCDAQGDDALAHGRAFLSAWFRSELRDDRALFFVDHMPAGMYHYRYLARATTPGKFVVKRSSRLTNSVHSCAEAGADIDNTSAAAAT